MMDRPYFMRWIDVTTEGWKLKKDAPKQVEKDFEEYKKEYSANHGGKTM